MLLKGSCKLHPLKRTKSHERTTPIFKMVLMDNCFWRHRHLFDFKHFTSSKIIWLKTKLADPHPKKEKRWKFVSTQISQDEYKEITQAAKEAGQPRARWIRTKLIAAARLA